MSVEPKNKPFTRVYKEQVSPESTSRAGLTDTKGSKAGSSTSNRSAKPQSRKNKANPFAQIVRKST